MYAVTVEFDIHADKLDAFLPLMLENARTSREAEPGCLQFDVCREGAFIFLYELYEDRAAFDAHLASAHFKSFDAAVGGMIASKRIKLFDEVLR